MTIKTFNEYITESKLEDDLQREFTKIINQMKVDYRKWIEGVYRKKADELAALLKSGSYTYDMLFSTTPRRGQKPSIYGGKPFMMLLRSITRMNGNKLDSVYEMKPATEVDAIIKKEADHDTEMFYTSFLNKNVAKFADILKGQKIAEISSNVKSSVLTGWIRIKTVEGASFRASFSVITKLSPKGKWFNQFPTRFHDVVNSDGTKLGQPSEAKMKKDFH